VIWREIISNST